MNYSIKISIKKYVFTVVLVFLAIFISGCSDSGVSLTNDNLDVSQVVDVTTNSVEPDNQSIDLVIDNTSDSEVSGSQGNEVVVDFVPEPEALDELTDSTVSDNQTNDLVVEEPNDNGNDSVDEIGTADNEAPDEESGSPEIAAPATVRVDFDITVPAYHSEELQVSLDWGDITTTATQVGEESWVISEMFPANTENLMVITFADRNGYITLGRVEESLITGSDESQTVRIWEDQFDTDSFDTDNDGVSNLDELMAGTNPEGNAIPHPVQASLEILPVKAFRITWEATPEASHYRVLENPDGVSGFSDVSGRLDASTLLFDRRVAIYARVNAQYLVQSCNDQGCADSDAVLVTGALDDAIGYFKASNPGLDDQFGLGVSLSADGNTLAVGARLEDSAATGINGDQSDNSVRDAGAVYVFFRSGGRWQQQAYLKASNAGTGHQFGSAVSLSADGNSLAVGATGENSSSTGINGDQITDPLVRSGAVYVFVRTDDQWQQQAYLKASNTGFDDSFGGSVSLSGDGNTLAVGATMESSGSTGINADQSDNSARNAGAVYVFVRNAGQWRQQAYLKAASPDAGDNFGGSVSLSTDGNTLALSAFLEQSAATGINGDQNDNSANDAGAVYVFVRIDEQWLQQAYIKASNTDAVDNFGTVSLSGDGNTLAVGALFEDSAATGIDGDQTDNSLVNAGAAYVFVRNDDQWQQQAYLKASNPDEADFFGFDVSLSADGNTLAVVAAEEQSAAMGINGDQSDNSAGDSGATYVFVRRDGLWQQQAYLKASNSQAGDRFGFVSLSGDGRTLAVGALGEDSAATGINNGDQNDNTLRSAGAVYLY